MSPLKVLKKIYFILLLAYSLFVPSESEGQIWARIYLYYGSSNEDVGKNVIETSNGDLIVPGEGVGHLMRLDKNGDIIWRKHYENMEAAFDVAETSDGGFVLIGKSSFGTYITLIKTNQLGEKLWVKDFIGLNGFPALISNYNGGITILIQREEDTQFIITDNLGNILTQKTLDTESTRITQLENGYYIVAGSIDGPFTLICLDINGNILWQKNQEGIHCAVSAGGNDFIVLGYKNVVFLARYSATGDEIWYKELPGLPARPFFYTHNKVVLNDKKEIAFIGFTDGTAAFIAKTDSIGELICAQIFTIGSNWAVVSQSLIATMDGGFVVAGEVSKNSTDLFLMKTDSLCQTGELEIIDVPRITQDTLYADKFSFQINPNPCTSSTKVVIQPTEPYEDNTHLLLFDILGRPISDIKVLKNTVEIDTENLPGGMYQVVLYKGKKRIGAGKLIVVN